jgi:drug/metabolite transporter (DMT)-like permease
MHMGLAVGAALGSALCFAVSSVMQQRGAADAPRESGARLLLHLLVRPIWLGGISAAVGTLALQAVALGAGQIVVVQPLMVLGLLFALPVSVLLHKRRPSLSEWAWATLLFVGLTVFLVAARPETGPALPNPSRMLELGGAAIVLAAVVVGIGVGPGRRHRAALFGLATGITYGLSSALMKYSYGLGSLSFTRLLTSWPVYALLVVGAAGIMLNQAAYQAGPLAGALPPLAIADPIVAIVFGVVAFDEALATTAPALAFQVLGFGAMALAIAKLAHFSAGRDAQNPHAASEEVSSAPAAKSASVA